MLFRAITKKRVRLDSCLSTLPLTPVNSTSTTLTSLSSSRCWRNWPFLNLLENLKNHCHHLDRPRNNVLQMVSELTFSARPHWSRIQKPILGEPADLLRQELNTTCAASIEVSCKWS